MKFTKMQGCGNDYVYVNGFTEKLSPEEQNRILAVVDTLVENAGK